MLKPPLKNSFKAKALDLTPIIIAIHDIDHNIVWANKAYQKATSLSLKEIEGNKCFSVWGLDKPCRGCPVLTAIETGEQQQAELTPQNQNHWPVSQGSWLSSAIPIKAKNGDIIGVVETALEISDLKKAEEAIRKSEQEFRVIAENVPALFSYVDNKSRYRFVNKQYQEWFQLSEKEIVGKHISEVLGKDAYERIKDLVETALSGDRITYETELPYKHGGVRYVTVDYVPDISERGKVKGFYALVYDNSDLKKTQKALMESEENYRSIVEFTDDFICLVDENGNYIFLNQKYLSRLGLPLDEVKGRNYSEFHSEKDTKDFVEKIEQVINSGNSVSSEYQSDKDGKDFVRTLSPVKEPDGEVKAITMIAKDITDRKQVEEKLRHSQQELRNLAKYLQSVREQERKSVAREIHDELGQALTGIKMDLAWLKKRVTEDPEAAVQKIKAMDELTGKSIKLTKQIISRLRPGMLDDLGLVAGLEWEVSEFEKRTGIACNLDLNIDDSEFDEELSIAVFRICQEALSNVQRHSGATKVQIQIEQKSDQLVLTVKDDGKGIKTEQISHPESFGLMGIRERVHQLNGQYSIEGINAEGTTVKVTFPISKS